MRLGCGRLFTAAESFDLWRRYKDGESILGIAHALGRRDSSVHKILQRTGGIAPALRCRSARVLNLGEREEVSRGLAAGNTIRAIARKLNRAASTVSQEVSRHGGRDKPPFCEVLAAACGTGLQWEV
jgi:IS30 family transposase